MSFWLSTALILAVALVAPFLSTSSYTHHLFVLICMYVMLTVSYNLVVGFTGYLTLAHTTFFGIGVYASAILTAIHGQHWMVGIVSGLMITGLLSTAFGWLTLSRLKGFTFSIVTLGLAITAYIIVMNWLSLTRGPMGIAQIPRPTVSVGTWTLTLVRPVQFYYLGLCLVAMTLLITRWIAASRVGRSALSIRENERLARAYGVDSLKYKLFLLIVASLLASLAGAFYAHYMTVATPDVFWTFWITGLLAMLIVGGPSSMNIGIVAGTILLVLIPEFLRLAQGLREMVYGIALLAMIIMMPQGLSGLLEAITYRRRLRHWRSLHLKK